MPTVWNLRLAICDSCLSLLQIDSSGRLWALLAVSYVTVLETVHILLTGHPTLSVESGLKLGLVPAAQLFALIALARVAARNDRRLSDGHRLEWFFASWLVLGSALYLANAAIEVLVVRRIDLTAGAVFLLLAVPAAQAAAVTLPPRAGRRLVQRLRALGAHRVVQTTIWLDAVMLVAGWTVPHHPLIGIGISDALQRRWMGIKLIAAALTTVWSFFPQRPVPVTRSRRLFYAAAVVFAALGIEGLHPWMYALSEREAGALARR